jgi:hypothetical protein
MRDLPRMACLACLLPLLLWHAAFQRLWYFGDDWVQLSEMAQVGFASWVLRPFAENVVPLYKLLWGAAIYVFDGSYFALIVLVWLTHILNLWLLAKVLKRCEVPPAAIVCAVLTCGMPWTNIESLAWSVQWTGLLSSAAWLATWLCVLRLRDERRPAAAWVLPLYFASLVAAPLFHSRGILNGLALGACLLFAGRRAARLGAWSLAIAAVMAGIIYLLAARHAPVKPHLQAVPHMLAFAFYYLTLNPVFGLLSLPLEQISLSLAAGLGALKAIIVGRGFAVSPRQSRPFLMAALLMELGYAAVLGFGRYHTGVGSAPSSRYQYMSWFGFAPFLGMVLNDLLCRITQPQLRRSVAAAVLTAGALFLLWPWKQEMENWSGWRGVETRETVRSAPPDATLRGITVARARELVALYHLK